MYVSGELSESDTVLVDVGTGYYIDMVDWSFNQYFSLIILVKLG